MISQDLVAALDDLIQAGASASAALRGLLANADFTTPIAQAGIQTVAAQEGILSGIKTAARTEQSMPTIISNARDVVVKLSAVAASLGDSTLASSLKLKADTFSAQMKASGLGTPWLTILGVGAGAIAAYFLWKQYSKKKSVASFEYPEPQDDIRPKLKQMSRALGGFRAHTKAKSKAHCRPLPRKHLGAADKYEFEPETRLEGFRKRGGSRRRVK